MFKRIIHITLMLTLLSATVHDVLVVVSFAANRAYLAEVFCINKEKPELECNGYCQLIEQMSADEADVADGFPVKVERPELIYCALFGTEMSVASAINRFLLHKKTELHICETGSGVFHPPEII